MERRPWLLIGEIRETFAIELRVAFDLLLDMPNGRYESVETSATVSMLQRFFLDRF